MKIAIVNSRKEEERRRRRRRKKKKKKIGYKVASKQEATKNARKLIIMKS